MCSKVRTNLRPRLLHEISRLDLKAIPGAKWDRHGFAKINQERKKGREMRTRKLEELGEILRNGIYTSIEALAALQLALAVGDVERCSR